MQPHIYPPITENLVPAIAKGKILLQVHRDSSVKRQQEQSSLKHLQASVLHTPISNELVKQGGRN